MTERTSCLLALFLQQSSFAQKLLQTSQHTSLTNSPLYGKCREAQSRYQCSRLPPTPMGGDQATETEWLERGVWLWKDHETKSRRWESQEQQFDLSQQKQLQPPLGSTTGIHSQNIGTLNPFKIKMVLAVNCQPETFYHQTLMAKDTFGKVSEGKTLLILNASQHACNPPTGFKQTQVQWEDDISFHRPEVSHHLENVTFSPSRMLPHFRVLMSSLQSSIKPQIRR